MCSYSRFLFREVEAWYRPLRGRVQFYQTAGSGLEGVIPDPSPEPGWTADRHLWEELTLFKNEYNAAAATGPFGQGPLCPFLLYPLLLTYSH